MLSLRRIIRQLAIKDQQSRVLGAEGADHGSGS